MAVCVVCVLPHGAVGWFAVCDCGISCSYSLTFWYKKDLLYSDTYLFVKQNVIIAYWLLHKRHSIFIR